jgi:hypothetical protein
MSFTSLTASKTTAGSIKRWVNHSELDSEQILEEAQALLAQTLRVREMRAEFSALSMSVGDSYKALPTGFLDPIGLWDITNNFKLTLRTEETLQGYRTYTSGTLDSGTPYNYAIFDERLQFEYKYDAIATLKLIGFKKPTLLAADNLTNFLTDRYPHLLRCACVAQAYEFRNEDERAQRELTKLAALIAKTNAESDLSYRTLELDR